MDRGFVLSVRINFRTTLLFLVGFAIGTFFMTKMFLTREVEPVLSHVSTLVLKKKLYDESLATELFHEVRIFCLVMTNPDNHRNKADYVKRTWGKRCNKLLFITTQEDDELDTIVVPIEESRKALRRKTKTGFLYAHDNHLNDYDWFLKADDDRFVKGTEC